MKTITINLDELKAKMIERGYKHENLNPGTEVGDGWSEIMLDAIEELTDIETKLVKEFKGENSGSIVKTPNNTSNSKLPTKEELWDHLRSLPTPSLDILLGGTVEYYVNAAHDFMRR